MTRTLKRVNSLGNQRIRKDRSWVFGLTRMVARIYLSLRFRFEISGLENLPVDGPFILLPKHQQWEDIPLLGIASPRPLFYMAKAELFRPPFLRWVLSYLGGVPVSRSRPLETRESLRRMTLLLQEGEGVAVFPEGTYFKNTMGPGHIGLVRMVYTRVKVPFIPAGICYQEGLWRNRVHIRFGRSLETNSFESAEALLSRVMEEIARLSELEPVHPS